MAEMFSVAPAEVFTGVRLFSSRYLDTAYVRFLEWDRRTLSDKDCKHLIMGGLPRQMGFKAGAQEVAEQCLRYVSVRESGWFLRRSSSSISLPANLWLRRPWLTISRT